MREIKSLVGQTFGHWTVLAFSHKHGRNVAWLCRCECGKEKTVWTAGLKTGKSRSCGCKNLSGLAHRGIVAHNRIDLVGKRFGQLVVLGPASGPHANVLYWQCRCDCGGLKIVRSDVLRRGGCSSCGCTTRNRISVARTTHGATLTAEFRTWISMKGRCSNPRAPQFVYYGARGISVCERWIGDKGFENFLSDMGQRPSHKHSINRKDNNGNYSPDNCEWATGVEQARNRRNNTLINHEGQTKTLVEWSYATGIPRATIAARIYRHHWSIPKALTHPIRGH